MVNALKKLNGNSNIGEVFSPHVLDELGVMTSLDPDSRLSRDASNAIFSSNRSGVCDRPATGSSQSGSLTRGCSLWRERNNGLALKPKPAAKGERTLTPVSILKFNQVHSPGFFNAGHRANPSAGNILKHHAVLDGNFNRARPTRARPITMRVEFEDIGPVHI